MLASEDYPEAPVTGRPIEGLAAAASVDGVHLAHAATAGPDAPGGDLIATGGRVLNVTTGKTERVIDHLNARIGEHRRAMRWAISDLLGIRRTTVELI